MAGRNHLFIPGPTNLPDAVLNAMHRNMEDHRSPDFPALVQGILADLPGVFGSTAGTAVLFPASGSGIWEAALVNTLAPGARVLVARKGQFSVLWADAAQRLGYRVDTIDVEWGMPTPADQIGEALVRDVAHEIAAVLVVHNETATGVTSDIGAVRRAMDAARHPALLMVDGVSSVGSLECRMDAWGVDAFVTGSQKGLMLPPGLGVLCLSPKAVARVAACPTPRAYFDLRPVLGATTPGFSPYTPAISLLHGMRAALDLLKAEGTAATIARHARLGAATRAAVAAWGLSLCCRVPTAVSNTVTTVMVPDGADARAVIDFAYRRYNLSLGAGLARLAGRAFRIGHLGDLNDLALLAAIAGTEMALRDAGLAVTAGSGVAAAEESIRAALA
ncbi:MAG: aminotransferase class V-fold PLP-dependent enzyme [Gemmatimonadetes bacterium]|nr:aminotransferase class V-fold PLP-dependent enzyme [Gemmatimonadota bacterium]